MPIPAAIANGRLGRPSGTQQVILPRGTGKGRLRRIQRAAATGSLGILRFCASTLPVPKGIMPMGTTFFGDPLNDVKDGAIAAADNDGVVAFCYCALCLGSSSSVFARFQNIDGGAGPDERCCERGRYTGALLLFAAAPG